jgi:predicted nucleic acid-binding protein
MPVNFFDSSALVKRYLPEVGSAWVDSICIDGSVAVSTLVTVELTSSFARRAREGRITIAQRNDLMRAFLTDRGDMLVQRLTNSIIQRTVTVLLTCPPSIPLRSLDAIQLVSAEHVFDRARKAGLMPGMFVSSDARLLAAAQWAGFPTDNPNNHP